MSDHDDLEELIPPPAWAERQVTDDGGTETQK